MNPLVRSKRKPKERQKKKKKKNPRQAARHRFQGSELGGWRFWTLVARLQIRGKRPGTVSRAQNAAAGVFGRLSHACKSAASGQAPFPGLRTRRLAFLDACRTLANPRQAARHRFQGSELGGWRFWTLVARLQIRGKRPGTVFRAQNSAAGVFGRLSHACKSAASGQAPFSGLRTRRLAFLDACRTLANPRQAAMHRFQGSELGGWRFWTLVPRLQIRGKRPGTVSRAQNSAAGVFGRLSHACKSAASGQAPFSGLRTRRLAFLDACRTLANPRQAARHRFQGSERGGWRFWTLVARLQIRGKRPGTVFRAQNAAAGVFGRLSHACKSAASGQAPFSGLRTRRLAFLDACRTLANPRQAARHRFQGSERGGWRFWTLVARLQIRGKRPGTVFRAQNSAAGVFGRLSHACKSAASGQAPFPGLRTRRLAFLDACRTLANPRQAARHRFQGSELGGWRFWTLVARLQIRGKRPGTVFRAQNAAAGVFGRLSHACKSAASGHAPFSGLRTRRLAFLDACRTLANPRQAARHRFQGSELGGWRFWTLVARLQIRGKRPCTVFRAQNAAAGVFGRLSHACKSAASGQAPFSGLRTRRLAFLDACRTLANPRQAARHRFQGSERGGWRFWTLVARLQIRGKRPGTVSRAQNAAAGVFGRLSHACKSAASGQAPFPGLRTRRLAFLDACRTLANPRQAARHRFQGSELGGWRFWTLVARLQIRGKRPGTVSRAQNSAAGVFGRLSHACKSAASGQAPFSGLRTRRLAFLDACRTLANPRQAARHRFQGSERGGWRFWTLVARLQIRGKRPGTVFRAQNAAAGVFGRLSHACKSAASGQAPFPGLRTRRLAFLDACRTLANPRQAARHRFQGSELGGWRFWTLVARLQIRGKRPGTVFRAQNAAAGVFGRLSHACKSAASGQAPFSGLRTRRLAFLDACRTLANPRQAARHRFQGSELGGWRFWTLVARLQIRGKRPGTVSRAQNSAAGVFGRLSHACKSAASGQAPFSGLRTRRLAFLDACRTLANPRQAARHRFQGSERGGWRFWTLVARLQIRGKRPGTVFRAQNAAAGVFGRLSHACKSAASGQAPFSGLRTRRLAFLDACRTLANPRQAARHRFQGSERGGWRFWTLVARLQIRGKRPGTVSRAQNSAAGVFGRLSHACKSAASGQAPFSGLRTRRLAFLDACRTLANPRQAARHRFQGSELGGWRFWTLVARLQIRGKRPGTVFRAQNAAAGVFGRLSHACKSAASGQAPFSGLRTRRLAFLDACRTLANPRQAARHRFQGSELGGWRFWTLVARLQIRGKRPGTVFRAQNAAAGVFGRLSHACKSAASGQAPFPGLRTRRLAFLDACRTLANPRQAARHRFQGSERGGWRFWTLVARLQIRGKRPGTVFRAQNSAAGVFGRLSHACKSAASGQAPFSGLRTRRLAFLDACRTLANPRQAARHRFQGSERGGWRFWTLVARLQIRGKRPGTVFRAQNSAAGVFGRLSHACKSAASGQAPFSGLRTRRLAFLDACRTLANPRQAARHRFQGSELGGWRFWTLVARLQIRGKRPGTVSRAQNSAAGVFGRLSHACKSAASGQAPFSGLRTRRLAFLDACRTLANPRQAARHRFQGSERGGWRFWTLVARLQIRGKRPCTVFRAQNAAAGVFGRLSHACKSAASGHAPFSGLRTRRLAFLDACRTLANPRQAARHRFQGSELGGWRFWTLVARLQIRGKRPGTVFRAQNSAAGVFGRLSHACKSAASGQAPFPGLRTRRLAFLDACRTLANPRQAARHRFQGSELGGWRFWTLVARLQIRGKRPGTVFRAQNAAAGVFGRLSHACKSAASGQAPFSGLRTRRLAFSDACRTLANPRQAAMHRFQGSELGGWRFWTLVARLQIRGKRPGTVFRAQNAAAGVFGRLSHACKSAASGQAPFSGLRTRRLAFLDACRTLANPRQAARHRFQGSELGGWRFWTLVARLQIRGKRPGTVFRAQNAAAGVFGRLSHACKSAASGQAPFPGLRTRRLAFLDACRTLANPRQAARHRFQGSERGGWRFWTLVARLQIRGKRPGTVFRAQNSAAGVFGRLSHACKSAASGQAPFSGLRTRRLAFLDACRTLANPRQAARHRFQGSELGGWRFWTLVARLQIRGKRPGTVFRAQNSAAGVFGRLSHACKSAASGQAPFPGLRTRRLAFLDACRTLANPRQAARHRFQGSELGGWRFWTLVARLQIRGKRPGTVFRAQNAAAGVFGRLSHACKSAASGQAPFSGLRTRRLAFLDACRTLANPRQAARHRFQGSELGGWRFWTLVARLQIRGKRPGTVSRAQNSAAGVFGRLSHACKSAASGQAPFSGLRTRRLAFLDACRTLANPRQAARHRFQGSELGGWRFWTLVARLQIRGKRPGTVFRAQNAAAGVFGRLSHACKSAASGQAPFSGLRTRRLAFLDACRTLANPRQAARHRFQGSELGGWRFWTLVARLQIRGKRPGTVFRAQNAAAGVFGRLSHACKSAASGQAPFPGLRTRRLAFLDACRTLANPRQAARHRFQGSERGGWRFWTLVARLQIRGKRPGTVFRAQNSAAGVFGRLSHACKSAASGQAPFSGLRTRRLAFLDACRTLANPRQAARHRFQGSERGGWRFWTLVARLQIRGKRPGTVFRAQNSAAGVFGRLSHACKSAASGQAPFSGLRTRRLAFLDACRTLANPRQAARHRFQGSELGGWRFWTLVARLQIRGKRPGTVSRAQNSAAGVFGRLSHACKSAASGQAPFSGLRTRRLAFLDACRTLANPRQAARHRFQGSERGGWRFWTLVARLQIRGKRPCTVFRAQNAAAGVFGRLSHACKSAASGHAPFSGLRTRRLAFLDACRTLANPRQAARHRFQGSELGGWRFWTLVARLQIRGKRPGTVFRAQNSAAGVFGRLSHACKSAASGQAPFPGLRTRRLAFLDACRTLANPRQAARHRFQGSELGGWRFWTLVARLQIRGKRPGTVFRAQNSAAGVFGRLSHACKSAASGQAPFSGLRTRRLAFSDACRTLANPRQAAMHRFQGSELGGWRFWTLVARLQIRGKRPGTVFRAQNAAAGVFGRLSHACKSAASGQAPFSGLRTRRLAFLDACRTLANPRQAARHRFQGSELGGWRFWTLVARLQIRGKRPGTVFRAQNAAAGVFGRLSHACKSAASGQAPFPGLRTRRLAFLDACRTLANPRQAARHRFQGSERGGWRFWTLVARLQIRGKRPGTVFRAQNSAAGVFGRLSHACKSAASGQAPFSGLRTRRLAFLDACRTLANPRQAARHRFQGSELGGWRFWTLVARLQIRGKRPGTVFRAQNSAAGVFGRLSHACKSAASGQAPFSGLRTRRLAFLDACRTLANPRQAARHRFQGSERGGWRFWTLVARLQIRGKRPGTVFRAQNSAAGVFGRLSHACKSAASGQAPFSGLRTRRLAFSDACRTLANPRQAAMHRFQGSELGGWRFWTLVARLQIRGKRPGTVFRAQNAAAGVFGRLSHACKSAASGQAPFSGLRTRRLAFLDACRTLANPRQAARHRFQGSELGGWRFWTLVARLQIRGKRPGTVFRAQNSAAGVFGRLSHACKSAASGQAPFSGLRTRRLAFLDACRTLANPRQAARHRFQGSELGGWRFWTLVARLQIRGKRPCTVFRAQNSAAGVFGRLSHACKSAASGQAPFSGLRTRRLAFLDACRTLANPRQAARHRFQGSELGGWRFWTLVARLQIRGKRPGTVFRAQNAAAGVFGRLSHACKSAASGQAPFPGLRTRRLAFLDACRTLANPRQAARHRFQGSELGGWRFWTLVARLQIRGKRPGTVFRAQNSAAGVFGRLSHACKSAASGQAPFSGLRTRRLAFLDACRTLANPRQAARHRFQGSERGGWRFWTLVARLQIRGKRPCTVFRAQNSAAGVFGRLSHACKSAASGQAPFSGLRTRRLAFLDACRTLAGASFSCLFLGFFYTRAHAFVRSFVRL